MGQLALGFRSLLIRLAIFVVMAALLAWALGGTLLPRAMRVKYDAVQFDSSEWFWELSAGGRRVPDLDSLGVSWRFMRTPDQGKTVAVDTREYVESAGPALGRNGVWFAGRTSREPDSPWRLEGVGHSGTSLGSMDLPSRLAVEWQLARVEAGLPLLDLDAVNAAIRNVSVSDGSAVIGEDPAETRVSDAVDPG